MRNNPETVTVATKISPQNFNKIEELIKKGDFINKSDFIRTAIRSALAARMSE